MADIISLIDYEEGWRDKPYLCSEGYPTAGYGFKLGPKGAPLSMYQFRLPKAAGAAWLGCLITELTEELESHPRIGPAYRACDDCRRAILISMAYQMGIDGLAKWVNTLSAIERRDWGMAASAMLNSLWAKQTPQRAKRHAEQMRSGAWCPLYRK